jgi:hypothetical protein
MGPSQGKRDKINAEKHKNEGKFLRVLGISSPLPLLWSASKKRGMTHYRLTEVSEG